MNVAGWLVSWEHDNVCVCVGEGPTQCGWTWH